MRKTKIGLVFSGGGAKGAYHLGVWKAIRDLGLESIIEGVSGSSIGAITGYMFSIKEYEESYHFWHQSSLETSFDNKITKLIGYKNSLAFNNLKNNNFLSTKKIDRLLDSIVDVDKLKKSNCNCYVTCHNYHTKQPECFLLNKYSEGEIKNILKASSSIPIIFKKVKMNNKTYCDGGLSDNTPIRPLYENGYNIIIVVYLDDNNHIDYRFYPNAKFIEIYPQSFIGKFRDGVLDFRIDKINYLINKGYKEAYFVLIKYLEELKSGFTDKK